MTKINKCNNLTCWNPVYKCKKTTPNSVTKQTELNVDGPFNLSTLFNNTELNVIGLQTATLPDGGVYITPIDQKNPTTINTTTTNKTNEPITLDTFDIVNIDGIPTTELKDTTTIPSGDSNTSVTTLDNTTIGFTTILLDMGPSVPLGPVIVKVARSN